MTRTERAIVGFLVTVCLGFAVKLGFDVNARMTRTAHAAERFAYDYQAASDPSPAASPYDDAAATSRHPCEMAWLLAAAADSEVHARFMRPAYATATSGLTYVETCENRLLHTIAEGKLLSYKARAEHELERGDWRIDFDVANRLLEACEQLARSDRRLLASCRSQMDDNRAAMVGWGP
jgi:hypothetical protein